jgi:hypothetical protein
MSVRSTVSYIRSRLNERSTWILFGAAVTAAAALPWPWSIIMAAVGVIGALVPDGSLKQG